MKFSRNAKSHWEGGGEEGKGSLSTESGVLDEAMYEFKTRFKDKKGTNPEELIGAAHAGCYAMQLSFLLGEEDYVPDSLDVDAKVTFEDGEITMVHLDLKAKIPNIEDAKFQEIAYKTKEVCPVSKLLNAKIDLVATLL